MSLSLTRISCGIHQLINVSCIDPQKLIELIEGKFIGAETIGLGPNGKRDNAFYDALWLTKRDEPYLEYVYPPSIIIFSDHSAEDRGGTVYGGGGDAFMKYIEDHPEYGTCEKSKVVPNTNSRRDIALFTWYLNPKWIKKFWKPRNEAYTND